MDQALAITVFPVLFLVVLFSGGAAFRRQHVDMDGEPPIDRRAFYV